MRSYASPEIPQGTPFRIREFALSDDLYIPEMGELPGRIGLFIESQQYRGRPVLGLATRIKVYETRDANWWFYRDDLEPATEEEWDAQCVLDAITG